MPIDTWLESALDAWQEAYRRGNDLSPADLCRDRPDLLPALEQRVAVVRKFLGFVRPKERGADDTVSRPGDTLPLPWESLGGYRLLGKLGGGGMGDVYRAEDPKLGREVAIKVMRAEMAASPNARERFVRETRAAAALQHDHVVPIFHVGEDGGVPYLVMPLLVGQSLEARLEAGPLPPAEAARIGHEAALGLAAAHAAGLVHRDVKPANLWLEDPNRRVKVLDFGLARAADGADGLTRPGGILGTPAYMAPEQADGHPVDARADLFSLGATLYEMATGQAAFRRSTLTATLRAVADHHPPAPHEVNPAVPAALSDLIMRLLAKQAADRPTTAQAVADELGRLSGLEAGAGRAETVEWRPARTRGRARVAGAALVLLLAVGVAWMATRTRDVPNDAAFTPAAPEQPGPAAPRPLTGSVDLLVYRTDRTGREGLVPLDHPLAMPLRQGDQFKIVAEADRPSYLYLFWVDESGVGVPVYPWKPGEWGTRPAVEQPVTKLNLVHPNGKGFEVTGDREGMETILMLARSTKLEASEGDIKGWFAGLKPLPFRGEQARVWFEDFDVLRSGGKRGFTYGGDVSEPDGPRGLQLALKQKVGPVELARAISFARVGNK